MAGTMTDVDTVLRAAGVEHIITLADVMQDLIAITDLERTVTYLNASGARLVGLSDPADAIGQPMSFLTTEAGATALHEKEAVVQTTGFWRGTSELVDHATGEPIPVEADCFLVRHPDTGASLAFLSLQRDMRTRRAQELELERWAMVAKHSQEAMFTVDAEGSITSWNSAAERIFGWTAEEAMAGGVEMITPNFDGPSRAEEIRKALRGDRTEPYEVTRTRKDGSMVVAEVTVSTVPGVTGDGPEIAILARDITEQRRVATEAAASELQLREMAQNMGAALWLREIDNERLLYVSPGYDTIFGASRDELKVDPRRWLEHVVAADRERARAWAEDMLGTEEIELRIDRGGEQRWVVVRPFVIPDADGRPYRRGGVVEDITAVKEEATRLRELAELRRRLVTQTLEAEERERSRLSVALHDEVLQLLLAAKQDLDDAAERPAGDGLSHARTTLIGAVAALRSTVRDLHPLVLDHLGVAAAIREIGGDFARRGGFTFRADIADDLPKPSARMMVGFARELISNAARHARPGRVYCRLRATGEWLRLEVRDDGRGFAPERLAEAVGAGHIGLASTRERVEGADGRITVDSAPGSGTTVTIDLPLERESAQTG